MSARCPLLASWAGSLAACLALSAVAGAQATAPRPGTQRPAASRPAATRATAPAGPTVGASATYRWTSTVSQPVAVVMEQPQPGGPPRWSVSQERTAPDPLYVTYGVLRGDGRTYTLQIVTHEQPEGTPLSVTQVTINRASGKTLRAVTRGSKGPTATPESGLRPLNERALAQGRREEVTVPAGRFQALQSTVGGTQVWVSDSVPALGLVKAALPDGTLELVRSSPSGTSDLLRTATK